MKHNSGTLKQLNINSVTSNSVASYSARLNSAKFKVAGLNGGALRRD